MSVKFPVLFISLIILLAFQSKAKQIEEKIPDADFPWIVLAHYQDKQDVLNLKEQYDLWKLDEKNQTVLMIIHQQADYQDLIQRGFQIELKKDQMQQQAMLHEKSFMGVKTIDNFPCYRTVTETFAAMNDMNSNYSNLVDLIDIGDSWHKLTPGGNTGYDMQVVKITNENNGISNKPILYAMGSIHSREYPPAELVTRFAEHLLSEYGHDADVTWLVDYHEIHLLLQGNPDGRVISEGQSTYHQRKNRNENHCLGGTGFNMQGVDMNRNFEFQWGLGTGSSDTDCSEVFRGDSAVSEPETQAIHNYIQTLFPDDRPDDLTTQAPLDKPGVYLDIHNVAELTLFPWGFSNSAPQAPNHVHLQTLARRMSYFTGYRPEQSNASLGGADGASDDNAYGTLGVAAFTIELGEGSFYSSCNAFDNTIWPDNLPALIYAAKAARMPYVLASGPDVINLPASVPQVEIGQSFNVSGTATDLRFNNSNGTEATQNISAVKAYIGTPSWRPGAVAIDMSATDGSFDSTTEAFDGSIETTGLSEGRYVVWFEAHDTVAGVPSAMFVDVVDPANLGTLTGVVRDENTLATIEMAHVSYDGATTMTDVNGQYSIETTATTADLEVNKLGYFSKTINNVSIIAGQSATQNVTLEPTCEIQVLNNDVETYTNITDGGWTLFTGQGNNDWRIETGDDHSNGSGKAYVSTNVGTTTDKSIVSPELMLPEDAELIFWHKHNFEAGNDNYDGGVIEITSDGGNNWSDLGAYISQNGYNGTLNGGFGQPLGAVSAFVDALGTFTEVKVDLSAYNNQTVKLRWRMGTDSSVSAGDWKFDDIRVVAPGVCPEPNDLIFKNDFE